MKRLILAWVLALFSLVATADGYPFDPLGVWRVGHSDGTPILITAGADGSAVSDWGGGEQGNWTFEGQRLHFAWTDGWHDFIYRDGDGFAKIGYRPGAPLSGPPTNRTVAERVK